MKFKEYVLKESNTRSEARIFLDMDGVLCSFEKHFSEWIKQELGLTKDYTASEFEKEFGKNPYWEYVEKWGEEFWATMPWTEDGKVLFNYVEKYDPIILSSPSRDPASKTGKAKWLRKNIPELENHNVQTKARRGWDGVSHIILNSDKWRYATGSHDILIDDRSKNINAWTEAGGTGILHKSAKDTINQLKKLGL